MTPPTRSTREVLSAHLRLRRAGDLEEDLATNYSDDVVVLSAEGVHHGRDALRTTAAVLDHYVGSGDYDYGDLLVAGPYGHLTWSARRDDTQVHDGSDTYVVRDGCIRMQSIHYSVRET